MPTEQIAEISISVPVAMYRALRNDATAKSITRGDLLLADPRGLDDFLSSDLLQE